MDNNAIGLIETKGLIATVEAADACLKAACVKLLSCRFTSGGLVCVIVTGDVGAVKAAVDAGVSAAAKVGEVVGVLVIPRPAQGTMDIIDKKIGDSISEDQNKEDEKLGKEEIGGKENFIEHEQNQIFQVSEKHVQPPEEKMSEGLDEREHAKQEEVEKESTEGERSINTIIFEKDDTDIEGINGEKNMDGKDINELDRYCSEDILESVTEKLKQQLENTKESSILEEGKRIDRYGVKTLRKILRTLPIKGFDKTQISTMRRKELLKTIIEFVLKEGND